MRIYMRQQFNCLAAVIVQWNVSHAYAMFFTLSLTHSTRSFACLLAFRIKFCFVHFAVLLLLLRGIKTTICFSFIAFVCYRAPLFWAHHRSLSINKNRLLSYLFIFICFALFVFFFFRCALLLPRHLFIFAKDSVFSRSVSIEFFGIHFFFVSLFIHFSSCCAT